MRTRPLESQPSVEPEESLVLRNLSQRARAAIVVAAIAVAAAPVVGTFADESSSDVKNPECTDLGFATDVKFDPPTPGTYTRDGVTYSWTIVDTPRGPEMAWTSSSPVYGVISKGGKYGYLLTSYPGGATSGSALHPPANDNGTWAGFSHINFCGATGGGTTTTTAAPTTTTTVLPPLVPLTVDLDAAGSYTKTFLWSIDKSANVAWIARSGSSAPIAYDVAATRTGYDLSQQQLGGTVTITNPNPGQVAITSVAVGGATCQVQQPSAVASGETDLAVTCDVSSIESDAGFPTALSASIGWADPSPLATLFSASTTASASYAVTKVNETVTVVDAFDGGAATAIAPGAYTRNAATPATEGCRTVGNTATIVQTGQSDSASVTVCRQALTKGGFTIGFWQNKNGQAKITASLCSSLAAYGSAWAGSGFPTTCTTSSLQAWVTSVFKNANAKDHVLMLRAQMMATALNVLTDTGNHLGETDVPVGGSCKTVSALLSSTNASWSSLVADRSAALTIKDIFDRINNNVQAVCP